MATAKNRAGSEAIWPIGFGLLAIALLDWVHPDGHAVVRAVWGGAEFVAGYDIGLVLVLVVNRSLGYR
jgi:hypothetical protein